MNIRYLGLKKLDSLEIDLVKSLTEKSYPKVMRNLSKFQEVNMNAELVVNVKKINAEGNKANYHIKANIKSTAGNFDVEQADWDLARALHKVLNNLSNLMKKELKIK